jgi:two-component system response regulator MtrA
MTLVMVVDDDQDLAEMLGIVLTSSGFDVDLVSRGDEALEVFRNNPPDLVLLDVMLPGIDGIEVCRLIRQESMVPIVMLSAKGETQDIVRGLEAGADDYMQKPFRDKAELIARIRTRLRRTNADITGLLPTKFSVVHRRLHSLDLNSTSWSH